jgi:hypothetical protein
MSRFGHKKAPTHKLLFKAPLNIQFCDMYHLILFHSLLRWVVLLGLLWALIVAAQGYFSKRDFRRSDRIAISAGSISSHIQLLIGFGLYFWSPIAQSFWSDRPVAWNEAKFFGLVHFGLMTAAIILITIGSALAKRETEPRKQFSAVLWYYGLGLLLILIAIPWPFSPLAQRPWFRAF